MVIGNVGFNVGLFQEIYVLCFNESPLKMMKNTLFHLENSFRSQDLYIFVLTF